MKIPILLITHDRPFLLEKVLNRILKFTDFNKYDLWICDNKSTKSNKKIISSFADTYRFINIYEQPFNQISIIQNELIKKLKSDIYIKIDDDILVSENWTEPFIKLYQRKFRNMSIGSVVIPVNGFGWIPFLETLNLIQEFKIEFEDTELIQGCTEPAVWHNPKVAEFIWKKCLDIDYITKCYKDNQKYNYIDYEVKTRYSIGAIVFGHDFWEKMGGWKVDPEFYRNYRRYLRLTKISSFVSEMRGKPEQRRLKPIIETITKINTSMLGIEEEHVFNFSNENGLTQYVTSEGIVHHFSFFPTEEHLMKKVFLKIKF